MSINLSDLTSPNNQDSLAEITSGADFLDPIGKLKNLSRSPNSGGDALQTVALNQPRSLPLIKNPAGNLGGYLYIPDVAGNYATGPSVTIGSNETWEAEVDMVITQWGTETYKYILPMGGGDWSSGFGLIFRSDGFFRVFSKGNPTENYVSNSVISGATFNLKYGYNGTQIYADINGVREYTATPNSQSGSITHELRLNSTPNLTYQGNYAIQKAKLTVNSAVVFDCDFNGSTSIRHGDTKFNCVGGPVSLTKAGNDPITVVKKGVLRFDGVNDFFTGLLGQSINSGHIFVSFSWLGSGGDSWARPFGVHKTGELDYASGGFVLRRFSSTENLIVTQNSSTLLTHLDMVDSELGDMLVDFKISSGDTDSKINNADLKTSSATTDTDASNFNIAAMDDGQLNAAIDLEYLAVFPATITDAQADSVRNYINNRNNVFSLIDSQGYYFFDPQKATFTGNFTGANTLDGYITGSDNGDTDVRTNLTLEQSTLNDQPSTDGYTITFNDSAEHLDFENGASQNLSGWQVVGTSMGTFAYRVQGAVTELNLLGNLGNPSFRQAGDLYGIILLPESATGADIEEARKLLIDRGAEDGVSVTSLVTFWYDRSDILEFPHINTSNVTSFAYSWVNCSSLQSFPLLNSSSVLDMQNSWQNNISLQSFPVIQAPLCVNFTSAWQGTTALTSFPADAKLGTSAQNVNFTQAWRSSGLTSFSTPLPSGMNFTGAWLNCSSLSSFSADVFNEWNPSSIANAIFDNAFVGCTALTAQSVENILTSIDASGKYGTATGAAGGGAINSGIDISYNVATGSLSAATNTAIDSLSGKGWEVYINGVLTIPNVLTLAPAAAYSLRSFDSAADPVVVNVRRSSDSASSNFKASEVSDGTLTTWVNTEYGILSPTLNDGGFEDGIPNSWIFQANSSLDSTVSRSGTKSAKINVVGGAFAYFDKGSSPLQVGNRYTLSFWAKGSDITKQFRVYLGTQSFVQSFTEADTWEYFEITHTVGGSTALSFQRNTNTGDYTVHIDDITLTQLTSDGHVTTWYDQSGNNNSSNQTLASSQPKIVDGGTLVTEGGQASINFPTELSNLGISHSDLYGQATLDSYYVTNATGNEYIYPSLVFNASVYGMVARSGDPSTDVSNHYGSPVFYANGNQITGGTRDTLHTATSGVQKLVAHIGADTTDSRWGTASMNFGNYNNNQASSIYSFTGKLQEMIFFNTDQSANRTGIEANIMDTYSIS